MIFNPTFYEQDNNSLKQYDLFSRLLKDRIILIFNEINDDLACSVVAQLLYLESLDKDKDITIYINSPGGSVSAGLAIYDTIQQIKCDVSTVCVGMAASMGAFLLSSGTKGKRYALENSQVMIHQLMGGTSGQATDIEIEVKHMKMVKDRLDKILADNTNHTIEEIKSDTDRNTWMFGEDAMKYGLIDKVLEG